MSFILDALKKAEEERKKLESRMPFGGGKSPGKKRFGLLLIPAGIIVLGAAILASTKWTGLLEKKKVEPKKEVQVLNVPQKVLEVPEKPKTVEDRKEERKEEPEKEEKNLINEKVASFAKPKDVTSKKRFEMNVPAQKPSQAAKPSTEKSEEPKFEREERKVKLERMDLEKINALFNEAQEMAENGRLEEAKRIYSEILSEKPDHVEALNNLGLIYLREGRRKEALSMFSRSLSLKADYPKAYNNIGIILAEEGEKKLAEEYFRKAIEVGGEIESYINLSNLLRGQKRYAEAERLLLTLIEKGIKDQNLYLCFALIKDEKGEYKDAIKYYRAYLREANSKEQRNKVLERLRYLEGSFGGN